jgi:hypothetical protein
MASSELPARFKRILAHYRAGGFTRALKLLCYYGCVHNWTLWLADIQILGRPGSVEAKPLEPLAGYYFGFATENQLNAILTCAPVADRGALDKLFRRFFHDGYRCVVTFFEERVVGYLWAFTGEYVITLDGYRRCNLRARLPAGAVFTGNAYVTPSHRGRDLYQRMGLYLMRHYPLGTCFYAAVIDLNAPSLKVNHRLGFTEMATARFIGAFSRTLLYIRAAGSRRWRPFFTSCSDLRFDGARLQTVDHDSPCDITGDYSSAVYWPRGPMHIQRERRKISPMGRTILRAPSSRMSQFRIEQ